MNLKDVDKTKLSPGMLQYVNVKENNMDVILFFRLGDFYEMFFEDAILASRELELTLTSKNAGLDERVPMCGVPYHAASIYIDKLVSRGYKVAIAEQLEDPKKAKGIVKRDIIRVVSKGTIINNEALNEKENNYLGAILDINHGYVLIYTDITTGSIYGSLLEHNPSKLVSEVVSLNIKEVLVNSNFDRSITSLLSKNFNVVISYFDEIVEYPEYKYIYEDIKDIRYIECIKYLLTYITNVQKKTLSHFEKIIIKNNTDYMKMDIHTKRNLELTETLRLKERQYSLIWLLDKTKTAMGSRMLKNYIENPLVDKDSINKRYDIVETLLNEFILKSELDNYLDSVYDLERLCGRIAFGNASPRDLLQLKISLGVLPNIKDILTKISYPDEVETLDELYTLIDNSIDPDAPISVKDGYIIKKGYNSELDELKLLRT